MLEFGYIIMESFRIIYLFYDYVKIYKQIYFRVLPNINLQHQTLLARLITFLRHEFHVT